MSKPRLSQRQRILIKARAKSCCEYCRSQEAYSPDGFSIEHIVPLSKGGTNSLNNLANACQGCNNRKFTSVEAVDPVAGILVALYHPRKDKWSTHFAWNNDTSLIISLTPIGRATVAKLELNRPGIVNLRRVLSELGLHPVEQH